VSESCYHCGLPIPAETHFSVTIEGSERPMCCAGCQAVAQAIVANGLTDYYRHRDALPESPREALPQSLQELGLFDHPEVQKNFVRPIGEHEREASLILEGITCAACVWLNETHLARQKGITAVEVNYATRRARVRWDERQIRLSQILEAINAIGYRAHPFDPNRSEALAQKERRTAQWRVLVAGLGMMQVMMYAIPVYLAEEGTMTPDIEQLMRWASLLLTLPVMLYSAATFFDNAWRDIKLRRVGMDVPVALGLAVAFAASCWATLTASGEVYFDAVTMFVFFLLGGRYLEMMARQRAVRGIEAIARAQPAFAFRLAAGSGVEGERVAVADLVAGDRVLVKPGETVPADGRIEQGESSTDEALLTGESRPVAKRPGDAVIGGSVNVGSPLIVCVERVGEATRLASIQRLMERASSEKPRMVVLADRLAGYFVSVLLFVAASTWLWWWQVDAGRALWIFVAVLVVSCPCALSLATPIALTVATGTLSRLGVLVTRGHAIETLARATDFVFDKTGTLTEGKPALVDVMVPAGGDEKRARRWAAALEQASEHPLALALRVAADDDLPAVTNLRASTGRGVEGEIEGRRLRIGSVEFVAELAGTAPPAVLEEWMGAGDTVVALGDARGFHALFRISDPLRAGALPAVDTLRRHGVRVAMLSGDDPRTVAGVASRLGIADAVGGMSPEGKHARLVEWQRSGAVVAMAGDGVNDAPVLAQAHVSVAMGGGADLARSQADVVLLGDDLHRLAKGVRFARRTMRIVRQNLIWSFGYNLVAIPLAMTGWVTPWMAGIGMSASSLLVVLNSLRLQRED